MRARLLLSAVTALFAVPLTGCPDEDCEPGSVTANYSDPFDDFQDVDLPQTIYEVEQLSTGEERLVEVEIGNTGEEVLQVLALDFTDDSDPNWSFDGEDLPIGIEPGETATLEVNYTAQGGPDTYAIARITTDDPHADEEFVHVGFHGVSSGELPLAITSPHELDFGFTFRGEEVRRLITLRNDGTAPFFVEDVVFENGVAGDTLHLSCPGATLLACNWEAAVLIPMQAAPIGPGESREIEVAFTPTNQQAQSARLEIYTSDPQRPMLQVNIRGNGSDWNCTPPRITGLLTPGPLEYPSMGTQDLEIALTAEDDEQPINSIVVDMFIGGEPKEDAFTNAMGLAEFDLDLSNTDPIEGPVFTPGVQTILLEAKDTCQLIDRVALVAMLGGNISAADADGDGYDVADGDCDDADPTSYPDAIEVVDNTDNDCDGLVDDETDVWDDDCDGYCEGITCLGQGPAEDGGSCAVPLAADPTGDCNDSVRDIDDDGVYDGTTVHPDATEGQNRRDDDCDGTIDEGTNFYDDDGDGFSESNGDCDDDDPLTFGGGRDQDGNAGGGGFEYCDGADNDCDSETDENCSSETTAPRVVGNITLTQYEIPLGESVNAAVVVLSEDEALTYSWTADIGSFSGDTASSTVVWEAPEWSDTNLAAWPDGGFANLIVTVTDSEGRSAQGFTEVALWTGGIAAVSTTCGCSAIDRPTSPSWAALLAGLLVAIGLRPRRRS